MSPVYPVKSGKSVFLLGSYFQDGLKTIEHFHCYIEELVVQLGRLKQHQDAERRKLVELRDVLRTFMSSYKDVGFNKCLLPHIPFGVQKCRFIQLGKR